MTHTGNGIFLPSDWKEMAGNEKAERNRRKLRSLIRSEFYRTYQGMSTH